ncbi:uncharacterized protein DEA37_0000506 [Paragonimus westermani]|uniref:Uncharacterized protein n=1 Tax=Paragonimus westermani TaxID=34504 RepID=A0A5J4NR86_9TREM|nr:uncharacterized protein DEA37_0000506 [Paragonimus westermani]
MNTRWSDGLSLIPRGVTNELSASERSPANVHHRLPISSLTQPDSLNELPPTMPSPAMTCGSHLLRTTGSDVHRHTMTNTNIITTTGVMQPYQQHNTITTTNISLNDICFNFNHRHTLPYNLERSRVQESLPSNCCGCKFDVNELPTDSPLNVIPSVWGNENKTFILRDEPTSSPLGTFVNSSCNTRCSLNPAGLIHTQSISEGNRFTAIRNSQSTGDETGHTTRVSADMLIQHVLQSQSQAVGSESNRPGVFKSVPSDSREILIDSPDDREQRTFDTISDPGRLIAQSSIQSENKTNSSASAYNTQRFAQTDTFIVSRPSNWLYDSNGRTADGPKHMHNNTLEMGEMFCDNFQNHQHMIHSESKSPNPLRREFSFEAFATTTIPSSSAQTKGTEVDHRLSRMNCSESHHCFITSNSTSKLNKPMVDTNSSGHSVTTTTLSACGDILKSRQL